MESNLEELKGRIASMDRTQTPPVLAESIYKSLAEQEKVSTCPTYLQVIDKILGKPKPAPKKEEKMEEEKPASSEKDTKMEEENPNVGAQGDEAK